MIYVKRLEKNHTVFISIIIHLIYEVYSSLMQPNTWRKCVFVSFNRFIGFISFCPVPLSLMLFVACFFSFFLCLHFRGVLSDSLHCRFAIKNMIFIIFIFPYITIMVHIKAILTTCLWEWHTKIRLRNKSSFWVLTII